MAARPQESNGAQQGYRQFAAGTRSGLPCHQGADPEAQVGLSSHHVGFTPGTPKIFNRLAARLANFVSNRIFLQALENGAVRLLGARTVVLPQLKNTVDWIGLQYYHEYAVGFNSLTPSSLFIGLRNLGHMEVGPGTWGGLNPEAIFKHIQWMATTFKKPIYITESGVPDPNDTIRPGYLINTVDATWRAIKANYPVYGYFFWSLLDNFEWSEGYDPRYNLGLYMTNFVTQERTARASAHLYKDICSCNGVSAQTVAHYAPNLVSTLFPREI